MPKLCSSTIFFKIGFQTSILVYEGSIITNDNLLHTLWEVEFLRMPFWKRMGEEIFTRKIDQTYENCKGAVGIVDDIQIFGNEETHDSMFQEAIECMEKQP